MSKEKILTVAIATYNMEKYLEQCVDSLLVSQILDDIEILIINDGSTDNSLKIAHIYEAKYPGTVRVITKENGGYGSAINVAIDEARGRYFKTLDADDWFDYKAFHKFVNILKSIDIDLVVTHYSEEHTYNGKSKPVYYKGLVYYGKEYDFREFCVQKRTGYPSFGMHAITYRTTILRMNGFRLSHCYYSDMDYGIYPLVNVKSLMLFNIILYKYRLGRKDQSVSDWGKLQHFADHIYICRKMLDYYIKNHVGLTDAISLNVEYPVRRLVGHNIYVIFTLMYPTDKKRAKKELREFMSYLKNADQQIYQSAKAQVKGYRNKIILQNIQKLWSGSKSA